ncbi:MAG: lysophospholipid acyltransferase family protein [Alsobacter sp.]
MARLHVAAVLLLLVPVTLVLMGVQAVALRFGWPLAHRLPQHFHRFVCRLVRLRVTVEGAPSAARPLLVVSNHTSWLDITVISALAPVSFIAKREVGTWPVFGALARLQRSIFIDRTRRKGAAEANREIAERLAGGDALILFAEGTTSDGNRVLPFRSSLVGGARDAVAAAGHVERVMLQPLTIAYPRRQGLPLGRAGRPFVAWYGDMDLLPHLGALLGDAPLDAVCVWGEPVAVDAATDRKDVTRRVQAEVRATYRRIVTGRPSAAAL